MEHPLRERLTNFHLHGIALDENGMPISTMLCTSMTPVSIFALTATIRFLIHCTVLNHQMMQLSILWLFVMVVMI